MGNKQSSKASKSVVSDTATNASLVAPSAKQSEFGSRLFSCLKEGNEDSIILSPLSIEAACLLAAVGSKGKTKSEFEALFSAQQSNESQSGDDEKKDESPTMDIISIFESMKNVCDYLNTKYTESPIVAIANRIYVRKGYVLFPEYERTVGKALVAPIDFGNASAAAKTINDWVEQQTRDNIHNLVPTDAISKLTQCIMVNCVYYKGEWVREFDENGTKPEPFYADYRRESMEGDIPKVSMMVKTDKEYCLIDESSDYDIVALSYKQCSIQLIIALPKSENGESKSLTLEELKLKHSQLKYDNLILKLPKFKVETTYYLRETMQTLGLNDAFDSQKADFSGISATAVKEGFYISEIIHKAMIDIDETGTVAAAATAVMMFGGCMMPEEPVKPKEMTCDHPFYFYLYDTDNQIVLFSGRYMGK